ncbi:EamA family transporter [Clostridia bacterium]|nr:EamA family transporter [Clostridia bacterium]
MKKKRTGSYILILLAGMLWGTSGTVQSLLPVGAEPRSAGALRMLVGGIALFLVALLKGFYKQKISVDWKNLLLAAVSIGLFQPLFFTGISLTGVAFGTVLAIGSSPVFSGIIERISGNRLSKKWMIATGISILGCILLFSGQDAMSVNLTGSIAALLAGFSYAFYVRTSQHIYDTMERDAANGLLFLIAGLILTPILFTSDLHWVVSFSGILGVLHLGLIATAAAYALFTRGLVDVPAPTAVTLTLAEPLTAALLGTFFLGERLSFVSICGVILLFIGLFFNTVGEKEDKKN